MVHACIAVGDTLVISALGSRRFHCIMKQGYKNMLRLKESKYSEIIVQVRYLSLSVQLDLVISPQLQLARFQQVRV